MSISSRQNEVGRLQKTLADLNKRLADESKKEVAKISDISRIERSINKSTSVSTLNSKQQQIIRNKNDISKTQKNLADISKKIADTKNKLYKAEEQLAKEEERERNRLYATESKREREQLNHQKAITQELQLQYSLAKTNTSNNPADFDFFISHASEDKEQFVKPLAEALQTAGFNVWYDDFTLTVGDSLRRSIDHGLKNSRYGIVVLSAAFFNKNWTQYELDGLVTREMDGHKIILPIWHMVSKDQVKNYSPTLADKVALNSTSSTIDEIVAQLTEVIKGKQQ